MQQAWQEFKRGWLEANWGGYFILALFPLILMISFLDYLIEGKVSSPPSLLFWLMTVPAILISLYWAGLKSGLDNWLGRFVFVGTIVLLVILLIRHMMRTSASELTIKRRIGRYVVTLPMECISELEAEEDMTVSRGLPSWWNRFRQTFETLGLAFQIAGRATWST